MRISRRQLGLLIENYLLQETRQARQWIQNSVPAEEQQDYLDAYNRGVTILSDLSWIKKVRGGEPVADIVGDVISFRMDDSQTKLLANGFPTDLTKRNYPTVGELRRALAVINTDLDMSRNQDISIETSSPNIDVIGNIGPWTILLPKTKEGSTACDISGKDTTWCTTKTRGQNLFYNYAKDDLFLYYVMDYSRTPDDPYKSQDRACVENNDSRLSVGIIRGEITLEGEDGGVSVDAANKGLYPEDLESALGQYHDQVINLIKTNFDSHQSHPGREKFRQAAQNIVIMRDAVRDLTPPAKADFLGEVSYSTSMTPEVVVYLFNFANEPIRTKDYNTDDWFLEHESKGRIIENIFLNEPSASIPVRLRKSLIVELTKKLGEEGLYAYQDARGWYVGTAASELLNSQKEVKSYLDLLLEYSNSRSYDTTFGDPIEQILESYLRKLDLSDPEVYQITLSFIPNARSTNSIVPIVKNESIEESVLEDILINTPLLQNKDKMSHVAYELLNARALAIQQVMAERKFGNGLSAEFLQKHARRLTNDFKDRMSLTKLLFQENLPKSLFDEIFDYVDTIVKTPRTPEQQRNYIVVLKDMLRHPFMPDDVINEYSNDPEFHEPLLSRVWSTNTTNPEVVEKILETTKDPIPPYFHDILANSNMTKRTYEILINLLDEGLADMQELGAVGMFEFNLDPPHSAEDVRRCFEHAYAAGLAKLRERRAEFEI